MEVLKNNITIIFAAILFIICSWCSIKIDASTKPVTTESIDRKEIYSEILKILKELIKYEQFIANQIKHDTSPESIDKKLIKFFNDFVRRNIDLIENEVKEK